MTLRVSLPGGEGLIRNVSASGLYVEVGRRLTAGSTIALTIELEDRKRTIRLQAEGVVVRVASNGSGFGIGVHLVTASLHEVETVSSNPLIPNIH